MCGPPKALPSKYQFTVLNFTNKNTILLQIIYGKFVDHPNIFQ